jgi:hypothetical protein
MANLLATQNGRELLYKMACFLGRDRMSLALKRTFYQAFKAWETSNSFSLTNFLGSLNPAIQDEIESLGSMLGAIGCFEGTTSEDMDVYVNGTTGSDLIGDGSASAPYQSLAFLSGGHFPHFINHNVRILITGTVTAPALHLQQEIGPAGCFSIIGVGAPTVVNTSVGVGPFTLSGMTAYGSPVAAYKLDFTETFTLEELYGKWVRFETGAVGLAGNVLQIHENEANSIWTRFGFAATPAITNTISVVEPSATILCPAIDLEISGPTFRDSGYRAARVNLLNLTLDIRGSVAKYNQVRIRNSCHTNVSFVALLAESGQSGYCVIESPLNYYKSWDPDVVTLSQTAITNLDVRYFSSTNCGFLLARTDWPLVSFTPEECRILPGAEDTVGLDARGRIVAKNYFGSLKMSALGFVQITEGGIGEIQQSLLSGRTSEACVSVLQGNFVELNINYFKGGGNCLEVQNGDVWLSTNSSGGAAAFTGYGLEFSPGQARVFCADDPTPLIGATGQILFSNAVGAPVVWPGANAIKTDALGNSVSYIT